MTALPKHPPQTTTVTEESLPNIMHSATTSMPSPEIRALNVQVSSTVPSHTLEYISTILEPPTSNTSSKAHKTIDMTFEASSSALGLELPVSSVPAATIHDSSTDPNASSNSVCGSNPLDPVGAAPTDMAGVVLHSSNQGSSDSIAFAVVVPNEHRKIQSRSEAKPKRRNFSHDRSSVSKKLAPISSISEETNGRPQFLDDVWPPRDKAVLDQVSKSATAIQLDDGESTNMKPKAGSEGGKKSRRRREVVTDSNAAPYLEANNGYSSRRSATTARQFLHTRNGREQRRMTSKLRVRAAH